LFIVITLSTSRSVDVAATSGAIESTYQGNSADLIS